MKTPSLPRNRAVVFTLMLAQAAAAAPVPDSLRVYDQATHLVTEKFYDRSFKGVDWMKLVAENRKNIRPRTPPAELSRVINGMLEQLRSSHTEFLTSDTQGFHALTSIFSHKIDGGRFFQAGGLYRNIGGKWFVRSVLDGTPLHRAGLLVGDEIVSVNGRPFAEVRSFDTNKAVTVDYRRTAGGPVRRVKLTPEKRSLQEILLGATIRSRRVLGVGGRRVGYFHLWAGTHERFLEATQDAAREFASTTDLMILDLRDGYGGAWTPYVQAFFSEDLETGKPVPQIYEKPLFVLINGGVRSGKEYLALLLQEKKRGVLVGTTTAGYFLGGALHNLVDGKCLLYLAELGDFTGKLEGRGVSPDRWIDAPLPYAQGADPQLDAVLSMIDSDPAPAPH